MKKRETINRNIHQKGYGQEAYIHIYEYLSQRKSNFLKFISEWIHRFFFLIHRISKLEKKYKSVPLIKDDTCVMFLPCNLGQMSLVSMNFSFSIPQYCKTSIPSTLLQTAMHNWNIFTGLLSAKCQYPYDNFWDAFLVDMDLSKMRRDSIDSPFCINFTLVIIW